MAGRGRKRGTTNRRREATQASQSSQASQAGNTSSLPLLDPNTKTWFKYDGRVTRAVTDSIQLAYNEPWMNWSETTPTVRDQWFGIFKSKYQWAPEHETLVRMEFDTTGKKRLGDMVYDAAHMADPDAIPKFMTPTVWEDFKAKRNTPEFKEKAAKAAANKAKGVAVGSIHTGGSVSTVEYASRMSKDTPDGSIPTLPEVYFRNHSRLVDGVRVLVGDKPKATWAKYEELRAKAEEGGGPIDVNVLFHDAIGGFKKGELYGAGTAANLYFKQVRRTTLSGIPETSCVPGFVSQLQKEVNETKEELRKEREEKQKYIENNDARFLALQKQVEMLQSQWSSNNRLGDNDGGGSSSMM